MPRKVLFDPRVVACSLPSRRRKEDSWLPQEATVTLRLIPTHATQCVPPPCGSVGSPFVPRCRQTMYLPPTEEFGVSNCRNGERIREECQYHSASVPVTPHAFLCIAMARTLSNLNLINYHIRLLHGDDFVMDPPSSIRFLWAPWKHHAQYSRPSSMHRPP